MDVINLALKVERQLKEKMSGNRLSVRSEIYKEESSKSTTLTKDSPKEQCKSEGKKLIESSTLKWRRCFKCLGTGYI